MPSKARCMSVKCQVSLFFTQVGGVSSYNKGNILPRVELFIPGDIIWYIGE